MNAEPEPKLSVAGRTATFVQDVRTEMTKVTWPEWPQVRQLSVGVIVLSLFVGVVIFLMDTVLQQVMVTLLPKLFR